MSGGGPTSAIRTSPKSKRDGRQVHFRLQQFSSGGSGASKWPPFSEYSNRLNIDQNWHEDFALGHPSTNNGYGGNQLHCGEWEYTEEAAPFIAHFGSKWQDRGGLASALQTMEVRLHSALRHANSRPCTAGKILTMGYQRWCNRGTWRYRQHWQSSPAMNFAVTDKEQKVWNKFFSSPESIGEVKGTTDRWHLEGASRSSSSRLTFDSTITAWIEQCLHQWKGNFDALWASDSILTGEALAHD